jgi:cyclase
MRFSALIVLVASSYPLTAHERTLTKLAEGVYEIRHQSDGNGNGNTTIIIGDREAFVVDSCLWPSAAREDIADIRKWTSKPVRYLLNTHWHGDHNFGNQAYAEAFPSLAIIAHAETRKDMDLFVPFFLKANREDAARQIAAYTAGKGEDGKPLTEEELKTAPRSLARQRQRQDEFKDLRYHPPNLTFDHELAIDLGRRIVKVMYLGKGNTSGDAVVYLPKEKILIAGDLLVHPIPYKFDGYPSHWITTLESMALLDAETIVPGHGPVFHDKTYLYLVRDLLKNAVEQMNARLREIGPAEFHTLDKVSGSVDLTPFRARFAGDDKESLEDFAGMAKYLVKIVFNEATLR